MFVWTSVLVKRVLNVRVVFQVYVAAIRNRNLQLPENPDELYEISRSKASPETEFVAHRDKPFRC